MPELNRLNLTQHPIEPEPRPLPTALPEVASSTFEVGAGSEGSRPLSDRARHSIDEAAEQARILAERAREKFNVVAEDARERIHQFADQANHKVREARQRFNERLPEWKQQARTRIEDTRVAARRTARLTDEKARRYPLETIAAAVGAGFLIGATLRIWRSNRG